MSLLPADEAITRFKQNEERIDIFVNEEGSYTASGGEIVETLPAYIKRINFKLVGAFAAATVYALNNVVTYGGLAYLCILPYTSSATTPNADTTHWSVWPGVSAAALAGAHGSALIQFMLNRAGGVASDVEAKLDQMPSIDDLIPAGTTDHTSYFQQVMNNSGYWRIGEGPYNIDPASEITGTAGTKLWFEGTVINHPTTNKKTFKWVNVDDWQMLGSLQIIGDGNAVGTAVGVYREGCNRFDIQNVRCDEISGWGFYEAPGVAVGSRGDQGNYINCRAYNCYYGREDTPGTGGEYCNWVNYSASDCAFPLITSAGNQKFLGGNVVDNAAGVWVKGGSNAAHGGFIGMAINHNGSWNIRLSDVDNGELFSGCTCYGDSTGLGIIWLERSKGFVYTGGILSASIACDDATGYSMIANNYCPGAGVAADALHGGNSAKKVIYRNNFAPTGMWILNDPGTCYVRAQRSGAQTLPNNTDTTVIFNTGSYDTRDAFDETTGIFTLPWLGNFRVSGSIKLSGTAISAGAYGSVKVNGSAVGFFPIVNLAGGTIAVGSFSIDIGAAATAVVKVDVVASGTAMEISAGSCLAIAEVA